MRSISGADQTNEWESMIPDMDIMVSKIPSMMGNLMISAKSSDTSKLSIDAITGTTVDGFFLLPKGSIVEYFDLQFYNNDISNVNNTNEGFQLSLVLGANSNLISLTTSSESFTLLDTVTNKQKPLQFLSSFLSDPNSPVIKTDSSGIDWIRLGFQATQTETANAVLLRLET